MLDQQLAQRFIEKITGVTDYNVNIMDERGYIIASRNPDRIGAFHEIAYDIIAKNKEVVEVGDGRGYLGVRAGINMGIFYEGQCAGVVGVTGEPEKIREAATIIKMAIETMLSYEMQRELSYRHRDAKKRFLDALVSDGEADIGRMRELGENLGYDEKVIRIPLLCTLPKGRAAGEVLERIKNSGAHSRQDISFVTEGEQILVFKAVWGDMDGLFADYKFILGEYVSAMLRDFQSRGETCRIYVGTFQNSFRNYKQAYRHCRWLESGAADEKTAVYFYDHVDEYLHSIIPLAEFHRIFNVFQELPEEIKKNIIEIEGSLKRHNYNMVASSRELCLHKNTLAFRYEKIKAFFHINPIKDHRDRLFLEYLQYYLKNLD